MQSQQCQKCAAGTYSLGTSIAFDEWDRLPSGFVTHGVNTDGEDVPTDCSKSVYIYYFIDQSTRCFYSHGYSNYVRCCLSSSTWTPAGDYIVSNTDECTATLSYAVSLKKPGIVSFEYFYPDNSIYFEFFVSVFFF